MITSTSHTSLLVPVLINQSALNPLTSTHPRIWNIGGDCYDGSGIHTDTDKDMILVLFDFDFYQVFIVGEITYIDINQICQVSLASLVPQQAKHEQRV